MTAIHIRRAPHHACVAHVHVSPEGVTLIRVTPDIGPIPEWADLAAHQFPDIQALRRALIARMRAMARGEPQRTTLDRVLMSARVYQRWMEITESADLDGIDPESVPDETARPLPDGRLRIEAAIPGRAPVRLDIPADEWRWRDH